MHIELDFKPLSVNAAFQGRRFKTPAHNQYCKDILTLLPKNKRVPGFVKIHYKFYLVNWKMTDGGNLEKCLTDVLTPSKKTGWAGVIDDDRFIMEYVISKHPSMKDRIEIEIEPMELPV